MYSSRGLIIHEEGCFGGLGVSLLREYAYVFVFVPGLKVRFSPMKTRVVICGFGEIGRMLCRHLSTNDHIRVTGVVDVAPDLVGLRVDALVPGVDAGDLRVSPSLSACDGGDTAVVTTVSSANDVLPVILGFVDAGMNVITTCEELFWPYRDHAAIADELDVAAKKNGVAVLAAGINPGFLMDFLPVVLSGASSRVEAVQVERVQDATFRRAQFRRKIGVGMSPERFRLQTAAGGLRHVGLSESVSFIAAALGWELATVKEELQPLIAECEICHSGVSLVPCGAVRGVRQIGCGITADGREVVTLDFVAAVGETNPYDRILIRGVPEIVSTIHGGVNGDRGTCSVIETAIRRLSVGGYAGFLTALDLPPAAGHGV